jgi:hypothetical protein
VKLCEEYTEEAVVCAARAECARCRGRECGDCSDECRYWQLTASASEREILDRASEWTGKGQKRNNQYVAVLPRRHSDKYEELA